MVRPARSSLVAAVLGASMALCAGRARAQTQPAAFPTGIFFRAGATVSGFGLSSMTFRLQDQHDARRASPSFTGKQLALGREWLGGGSLSAHVDGPWFFVRVGADLYEGPRVALDDFHVESSVLGWISAGPRVAFGPFTLLAGLRVGALLIDLVHVDRREALPSAHAPSREYTGLGVLYAVDIGAQWRPVRWFQLDVALGQDVLGAMLATTASIHVNLGWSVAAVTVPH